jgi:methyltransferase-like protein 6
MLEFESHISSVLLLISTANIHGFKQTIESGAIPAHDDTVIVETTDSRIVESNYSFTRPPECAGDILLELPEEVWAEDAIWDEQRLNDAESRIRLQGPPLSSFYRDRYTSKAGRYWHEFYKRNKDHFYKDRHYLHRIFPELNYDPKEFRAIRLLEVGCGVGNAILPLIELNPNLKAVAVDFAPSAICILKENPIALKNAGRFQASVCDITVDELPVEPNSVDLLLCFFVLSAIAPELQAAATQKIRAALRVGGKVLFRDYGRYDEAQLRFQKGKKIDENFYVRQDGTCAYYFDLDDMRALFKGMQEERCDYILRQQANRKLKQARYRVWVESVFVKISEGR